MKKLFVCLIVLMLVFSGCTSKKNNDFLNPDGAQLSELSTPPSEVLDLGTFVNLNDLRDFFVIESERSLGTSKYNYIMSEVKNADFVIKPLVNGEDVSLKKEHARIMVKPQEGENKFNHIVYYYTNGKYNMAITVYYLDEEQLNTAKSGGYAVLSGVAEGEKTAYGEYNIVKNLSDECSYAERIIFDKYFITVSGASIKVKEYQKTIDTVVLDMLTFETQQIN